MVKRTAISMSLPAELLQWLDAEAARRSTKHSRVTRSAVICECIDRVRARRPKAEQTASSEA